MRRLALATTVALLTFAGTAIAAPTQPPQPTSGPGGSNYAHAAAQIVAGGSGADAWFLYLPDGPAPATAPLTVVMHGYGENEGHAMNGAIAQHTARGGSIVIYPRWQTGTTDPCPGPFNVEPCMQSSMNGIHGALAYLAVHPELPQPQMDHIDLWGFSFGAVLTVNLANRWRQLGLPQPRVVFVEDPDDSGLTGKAEAAVDDDLTGVPATTKLICMAPADGTTSPDHDVSKTLNLKERTCNVVFPMLGHIPPANKSLQMVFPDSHGQPALIAPHGVCAGAEDGAAYDDTHSVDALDWGYCWRVWDALRSCAATGALCDHAIGDTPANRYVGTWSDGTPVVGVKVQSQAPIRPNPVPDRQSAPSAGPDARPTVKLTRVVRRRSHVTALRGTAADDHGVRHVSVAVLRRSGTRCTQRTQRGRFTAVHSCAEPTTFVRARGTTAWQLTLSPRLPAGRYRIVVRVTDTAGNQRVLVKPIVAK